MSLVYANPGSGPSAGGIGWVNFENLVLNPGQTQLGITGTLNDGSTVTFDIESLGSSIVPFTTSQPPLQYSQFGLGQYTNIQGNVALRTPLLSAYSSASTLVLSNIVVKDSNGNPVPNYTAVVADAESTNKFPQYTEYLELLTDGGAWDLLSTIGGNPPSLTGTNTPSVTITGTNQSTQASYVLTTQAPSTLTLSLYGRGAVAIGFAITKVSLSKNIGDRIDSNDQFVLDIQGNPSDQATTTGITAGLQGEVANVFGFANTTYTINESMAIGSVNPLSSYGQIVSATNLSAGGIVPPTGQLPINVTPQLGDIIEYTILNTAPETFTKSVDKAYADLGDVLTYTITVANPNNFAVNNVLITDALPAGT
ncbi:MAG: CshA/CshB family fibrillar adhesin-related protein, partial [Niameybacter sp.]